MNLANAALFKLIKSQCNDKPACVLTIYRWFFGEEQDPKTAGTLIEKIRHLEGAGFKFSLRYVHSKGKKSRYLRTDLMVTFPTALGEPYVLGGRVPSAMIDHLEKGAGLLAYRAETKLEEDEAA